MSVSSQPLQQSALPDDPALKALHEKIFAELEKEYASNPVSYTKFANAKGRPYQSYERIDFPGLRWSVEKRIKEYGLERYFKPGTTLLDIGSNYGFFVTEFALHVKEAHGVEWVPELCRIGEYTADYMGVRDKVKFFPVKFEDFKPPCAYDTILTLASFFTSDKQQRSSAEAFFGKIRDMLKPGGELFYESTSFQRNPGDENYDHYVHALEAFDVLKGYFEIQEHYEAQSGPENQRMFVRCLKK